MSNPKLGGPKEDAKKTNMEELHAQTGPMDTKRPNTVENLDSVELPAQIMTIATGGLRKKSLRLQLLFHPTREDNARYKMENSDAKTQTHTDGTTVDITELEN